MKPLAHLFVFALLSLSLHRGHSQPSLNDSLSFGMRADSVVLLPNTQDVSPFFERYTPLAIYLSMHFMPPAAIILSVAALESGYGRADSPVVQECNNYFSIKTWSDTISRCCVSEGIIFTTAEVDCYLRFETPEESFRAFCRKMHEKRYRHLLCLPPWDYRNWARGLQAAGYATDPIYADKLIGIIERYNLRKYGPQPVPHPYDEPGIDQVRRRTGVSDVARSRVLQ